MSLTKEEFEKFLVGVFAPPKNGETRTIMMLYGIFKPGDFLKLYTEAKGDIWQRVVSFDSDTCMTVRDLRWYEHIRLQLGIFWNWLGKLFSPSESKG